MDTRINYVEAMRGRIRMDPEKDQKAIEHLTFMNHQQNYAPDKDLREQVRFVRYAVHLNEFLYHHHTVIKTAAPHCNWLFLYGPEVGYGNGLPFGLIYWTYCLLKYLEAKMVNSFFPSTSVSSSSRISASRVDHKQVTECMQLMVEIHGIVKYVFCITEQRHSVKLKQLHGSQLLIQEMRTKSMLLDTFFGWLTLAYYYHQYQSGQKRNEKTIKDAYRCAWSVFKKLDAKREEIVEGKKQIQSLLLEDAENMMFLCLGCSYERMAEFRKAAACYERVLTSGKVEVNEKQAQLVYKERNRLTTWPPTEEIDSWLPADVIPHEVFCANPPDPLHMDPSGFTLDYPAPVSSSSSSYSSVRVPLPTASVATFSSSSSPCQ
jgi:hypothetical protein